MAQAGSGKPECHTVSSNVDFRVSLFHAATGDAFSDAPVGSQSLKLRLDARAPRLLRRACDAEFWIEACDRSLLMRHHPGKLGKKACSSRRAEHLMEG